MRQPNDIRSRYPTLFTHTATLLSSEISRVWAHLSGEVLPETPSIQLEEKIPIPQKWDGRGRSNRLIGRILGPCGLSVISLEAEMDVES